jgi:beta-xylosidase
LVETQTGEWWFIHFQAVGVAGRIVHLQPAVWKDGWPVIGEDSDGDGCGNPVLSYRKPNVGKTYPVQEPQTSDEFNAPELGLQWQWHAIQQSDWYSLTAKRGMLRLYAVSRPSEGGNLHFVGNQLLQKFPAPEFSAEVKLDVSALATGERAGLVVQGSKHSYIAVDKTENGNTLSVYEGKHEVCGYPPHVVSSTGISSGTVWLKVHISQDHKCKYSYSTDGVVFNSVDHESEAKQGTWIGAKIGLFCISPGVKSGKGYIDADYFRIQTSNPN